MARVATHAQSPVQPSESGVFGWEQLQRELQQIDKEHERTSSTREFRKLADVTREHWKQADQCSQCSNRACAKRFTPLERKIHCRRCGEIFCDTCTQYKRNLAPNAQPDPDGRPYRVCATCFDKGPQTIGRVCNRTDRFKEEKLRARAKREQLQNGQRRMSLEESLEFRRRMGTQDELNRLLCGFEENAGSWIKSTVAEFAGPFAVPAWQRSPYWVESAAVKICTVCRAEFGLRRSKHHCKVCGSVVCKAKSCSAEDLLLFLSDTSKEVCWALYGLEGTPEKEPSVRLYLRSCSTCHEDLERLKVKEMQAVDDHDGLGELVEIHSDLEKIQQRLEKQLPMFRELVESLDADLASPRSTKTGISPIQTLAKAQMDVSDFLSRYAIILNQRLRKVRPMTNGQTTIAKRMASSKMLYYRERLFLFRVLKRSLEESTPPEVLGVVQNVVEKQTMTNVYICVRHLCLELLYYCDKYKLDNSIAKAFANQDKVWLNDMQAAVRRCDGGNGDIDDDWDSHLEAAKTIVAQQLKEKRLIRPRKRCIDAYGTPYVNQVVYDRSLNIILQLHRQLEAKSAERHFELSKESLLSLKTFVEDLLSRSRRFSV